MMTVEQAKELKSSMHWEHVQKELDYRIDTTVAKLENCSEDQLAKLQIRIKMYKELKRLPTDVIGREEDSESEPS